MVVKIFLKMFAKKNGGFVAVNVRIFLLYSFKFSLQNGRVFWGGDKVKA